jgi:CHAD domain-containing protein
MRLARECAFDFAPQDDAWLRARLDHFGAVNRGSAQAKAFVLDTADGLIAKLGFAIGTRQRGGLVPAGSRRTRPSSQSRWTRFIEELSPAPHQRDRLDEALQSLEVREALVVAAAIDTDEVFFAGQRGEAIFEIRVAKSKIAAAGKQLVVATAMFRHVSGSVSDFLRAVGEITDPAKMRLTAEAPMIRARRHLHPGWRNHVGAFTPRLGRAMDMRAAFRAIAEACFDQFLLNEAFVRELRDPEAVHQSRVALRRLRTALWLFRMRGRDLETAPWRSELKEISALLRDARDLDVFVTEQIEPRLAGLPTEEAQALLAEFKLRRIAAYDKLVAELESERAKRFYFDLACWIEADEFGAAEISHPETWNQGFLDFVDKRLTKAAETLLTRGDRIDKDDDAQRHETRIASKNLRYAAEFLESLLSRKAARKRFKALIGALKHIQEVLGQHNDEIVTRAYLAKLAQEPMAPAHERADAIAAAAASLAASAPAMPEAEFLQKARDAFRQLAKAKRFWTRIPGRTAHRGKA